MPKAVRSKRLPELSALMPGNTAITKVRGHHTRGVKQEARPLGLVSDAEISGSESRPDVGDCACAWFPSDYRDNPPIWSRRLGSYLLEGEMRNVSP